MSFYQELGNFYEGVFPLNEYKMKFIQQNINKKGLILDVACGVGTDVIDLKRRGYDIEGLDLEPLMIKRAEKAAESEGMDINFKVASMLEVKDLYDDNSLQNILITGNSLVHLPTTDDIYEFLNQAYNCLMKDGIIVIQIINFDRVLKKNIKELPTIVNEEKNIKFIRNYEYDKDKNRIKFITKLIADKEYENIIELIPLKKYELENMLIDNGFKPIKFFGSFKSDKYSIDSYATIVVATKTADYEKI